MVGMNGFLDLTTLQRDRPVLLTDADFQATACIAAGEVRSCLACLRLVSRRELNARSLASELSMELGGSFPPGSPSTDSTHSSKGREAGDRILSALNSKYLTEIQ